MNSKVFYILYFFYIMGISIISMPLTLFVVGVIIKGVAYVRKGTPFFIDDFFVAMVFDKGIKGGVVVGLSITILLFIKYVHLKNMLK
ncbi:hypothetical protein [Aeromonas sanarellii]|uniref:hypothetical protein n=1 Tax=Aeromonas sanarellii TaxID=633415 RepID=UPI003BA269B1